MGGIRLFVTNVPAVEENLKPSIEVTAEVKDIASSSDLFNSHVLGLKWIPGSDSLVISRGFNGELQTTVTQRSVLNFVSFVFNHIDLVAFCTVGDRLLLKDIWLITGQQWVLIAHQKRSESKSMSGIQACLS